MKIDKPHCSRLDRIMACPGSILPSDLPREAGGPDAILGRAKHEALSYIPRGLVPPVAEIASQYGVERDEIEIAVRLGERAWRGVGVYLPGAEVERPVTSSVCGGTADVVSVLLRDGVCQAISIVDWKTGWGADEHLSQLRGYALCLLEEFGMPRKGGVSVFEIWTTHQQVRTTNWTEEDLVAFRSDLDQIRITAESYPDKLEYRAGAHCRWCPHRAGCATRDAWMRGAVAALVEVDPRAGITRGDIGRAYLRFVEVERACRRFESIVKAALDDGPIPLPDGRRVAYAESTREKIGAWAALDALGGRLDGAAKAELLGDVTKAALGRWAKAHSAKGKKEALLREVMAKLRDAGAVREVPYRQREILDQGQGNGGETT